MIEISTNSDLIHEPLTIKVTGLPPEERVTIKASQFDRSGHFWQSQASFRTTDQGVIDLAKQKPLSGSYSSADPMGLFWSMRPHRQDSQASWFYPSNDHQVKIKLEVRYKGNVLEAKTITRKIQKDHVVSKKVNFALAKGELYQPSTADKATAILMLPGEAGALTLRIQAKLLASLGYTVLLLDYSQDYKKRSSYPLEQFVEAYQYLKNLNAKSIIGYGFSKGAEGLLACASYFSEIKFNAIILVSPSHVIWKCVANKPSKQLHTWSYKDEPLSALALREEYYFVEKVKYTLWQKLHMRSPVKKRSGIKLYKCYKKALHDELERFATIPVENVKSPILLISGNRNAIMPSNYMCGNIIERFKRYQSKKLIRHINFKGAGHFFLAPFLPTTVSRKLASGLMFAFGGTPAKQAEANQALWFETLNLFQRYSEAFEFEEREPVD